MNSVYSDYLLFGKKRLDPGSLDSALFGYDRFITAINTSDRVRFVLDAVGSLAKHGLLLAEYQLGDQVDLQNVTLVECSEGSEDDALLPYFSDFPVFPSERICVDSTGFLRPHLLFLLAYFARVGVKSLDILYSEPKRYAKGSSTRFSDNLFEVRQVRGYEGVHNPLAEEDLLLVGCGYDSDAMAAVATDKMLASKKVQMFPFPPLRPHMYQENRLRTEGCSTAFGEVLDVVFAPGYDPFVTAQVLSQTCEKFSNRVENFYLSPLATKAQVLGFGLFYLKECIGKPVSIILPISRWYNQETSVGLSEVWVYSLDLELLLN